MLAKKNRLTAGFFRTRKRQIESFVCGGVSARVYQAQTRVFRCAAVVPVKVDKRAVARNKVRRTIYTTIQNELKNLPVIDVIFFVSKTENIEADISAAIKKLL